ncbi:hypothetical protein tb265_20260 [Gemmatimonadetes bacterium T265]|nr:hypothetical protein tb265_20260 [Gemmatimonadetes bacterium T265]
MPTTALNPTDDTGGLAHMLYPEPSTSGQVIGYILAVPAGFAVARTLHYLLAPLRRSNFVARFVARVAIIGVFYTTFAAVMVGIAGPYVFTHRSPTGAWSTSPTDAAEMMESGLGAGIIGALVWPVVTRAKGHNDFGM